MLKYVLASAVAMGAITAAHAQTDPAAPMATTPAPAADPATQMPPPADTAAPTDTAVPPPPPPPPADGATSSMATTDTPSWAGLYGGIHGGYGFDSGRKISNIGATSNNVTAISTGIRAGQYNQNRSGILGGGQIGFNFQRDHLIFGAEGDFSYMADSRGTSIYRGAGVPGVAATGRRTLIKSKLDWLGSARARVGYAPSEQGFMYVTGGYAFGKVKGSAEFDGDSDATVNYYGRHKYTAQGWIAGVGGEFRPSTQGMWSKVSVGAEATYYDLGKSNIYALQVNDRPGYYRLGVATRGYNGVVKINYHF